MKPLILITALNIGISCSCALAGTLEYSNLWRWDGAKAKRELVKIERESNPDLTDKFSLQKITDLSIPLGKINISPDSKLLCFEGFDKKKGRTKVFVADAATGEITLEVYDGKSNESSPVFLNADEIIFSSDRTGFPKLWKLNIKTNEELQMTAGESIDTDPAVSSTGLIVFNSVFSGTDKTVICQRHAGGESVKVIGEGKLPKISPDEKLMAYVTGSKDEGKDITHIWISASNGLEQKELAAVDGDVRSLCWFGSNKLIFSSDILTQNLREQQITTRNYNVFMIDTSSKKLFALTDNPSQQTEVSFSQPEQCLYLNSNRGGAANIWKLNMRDVFGLQPPAEIITLAKDGKVVLSWDPVLYADGHNVYFRPSYGKNWWKANNQVVKSIYYTVEDLRTDIAYDFSVTSVDEAKMLESDYSKPVRVKPSAVSKAIRYGLKLSRAGGRFLLSWNKIDGSSGYNIYFSESPKKDFRKFNTKPVAASNLIVRESDRIKAGFRYYFKVAALNEEGAEENSSGIAAGMLPLPERSAPAPKQPQPEQGNLSQAPAPQAVTDKAIKQPAVVKPAAVQAPQPAPKTVNTVKPAGTPAPQQAKPAGAQPADTGVNPDDWGDAKVSDW